MGVRLKTDPNRPPVISNTIDWSFEVGAVRQISFGNLASDPDGDATTVLMNESTVALPAGFSFADDVLSWNGVGSAGVSSGHKLTASDGELISQETAAFSLTVTAPPASSEVDGYPRIGAYRIGTRDWASEPETSNIAQLHFVIINAQAPLSGARSDAKEAGLAALLALNPKLTIYDYSDLTEAGLTGDRAATIDGYTHSVTGDGWVYSSAGTKVSTFGNSFHVNLTLHMDVDGGGIRYSEFYAQYVQTNILDPFNTAAPSSYRSHVYVDVMDPDVRSDNQDFDRSVANDFGKRDSRTPGTRGFDAADEIREGHSRYCLVLQGTNPGMLLSCNMLRWSYETTVIDPADPNYPDLPHTHYGNLMNGGLLEHLSGWPGEVNWPFSGFFGDGTVNAEFKSYRRAQASTLYAMRACIAPKHVLAEWRIQITTNNRNPIVGTDMPAGAARVARYGMCGTWQTDAYVFIGDEVSSHNRTILMDYYGVVNQVTTGLEREWGGLPIDQAQEIIEELTGESAVRIGTDENGIFWREHENMVPIQNSTVSESGFIDIPIKPGGSLADGHIPDGEWWEVRGIQDPTIDRGIRVTTQNPEFSSGVYRLNSGDGRVLVRHGYSIYNSGLRL